MSVELVTAGRTCLAGAFGSDKAVASRIGILQVWDVVQHGYWHARSLEAIGSHRSLVFEWLRLPGDLVFIVFGAVPLVIATIKGWLGVRASRTA